jgi:hypothetical protein
MMDFNFYDNCASFGRIEKNRHGGMIKEDEKTTTKKKY